MHSNRSQIMGIIGGALGILGGLFVILGLLSASRPDAWDVGATAVPALLTHTVEATATRAPTSTPEPIIPTPTPTPTPTLARTPTLDSPVALATGTTTPPPVAKTSTPVPPLQAATPQPLSPTATTVSGAFVFPERERWRLGVSVPGYTTLEQVAALRPGWIMNWWVNATPPVPPGVAYAQTLTFRGGEPRFPPARLAEIARANPGATWLIGNEPDVRWQDNILPETYARLYHEAYHAIRGADPTAIVAAGGIAQPTPLRLRYLDLVLAAYTDLYGMSLPTQAWHIHNYMLREERDSWGVDIPPGLPDPTGMLYEIDDSGNLEVFRAQIVAFRRWMAERGYGGLPLLVTEFGIPMPEDYGFPPERVRAFLYETMQFFLTAADPTLGDPTDGGRLVQRWCWFSTSMVEYPTGNLVDPETRGWTHLGRTWLTMVGSLRD